jgi:hypothetical protein
MDQSKILNYFPIKSSSENPHKDTSMRSSDAFYLLDFENSSGDDERTDNQSVSFFSFKIVPKDKMSFSPINNKAKSNNGSLPFATKNSLVNLFGKNAIHFSIPSQQATPIIEDKATYNHKCLAKRNIEDYFVKINPLDANNIQDPLPLPQKRPKSNNLLGWLQPKRKEQENKL